MSCQRWRLACGGLATLRQPAGQGDIGQGCEVGHQIELLEYYADVVRPEAVTFARTKLVDVGAQQPDRACRWRKHSGQQAQEGALASAAWAVKKKMFTPGQAEVREREWRVLAVPAKGEIFDFECCRHIFRAMRTGF